MTDIDLAEFERLRESSIVVDVLPRPSYRSGHIPGAVNLPVEEITAAPLELPSTKATIIVYCGGPRCPLGRQAQERLRDLGYTNVRHYVGGLEEWTSQGFPLQRELSTNPSNPRVNPTLQLIDSLSLSRWVGIWVAMVLVSAAAFWVGGQTRSPGLYRNGQPLSNGIGGFGDCLYFSVVTATTLGYGDITPVNGWARVLASCEAVAGMVLVGALISKLLSTHQERLLQETHDLAFKERLGRIQTSLHILVSEFQGIESSHLSHTLSLQQVSIRLDSASAILIRDLRVVRDLLHEHHHRADETSMELLLVTLDAALQSYLDVISDCHFEQSRSSRQLGKLVEEICAECVPHQYSNDVRILIDRTHLLAQRILGIASAKRDLIEDIAEESSHHDHISRLEAHFKREKYT